MTDNQETELRKLLDERGLSYQTHYLHTSWRVGPKLYEAVDNLDGTLTVDNLTPEQAIAATLGTKRDRTEEWLLNACNQAATDYIAELERKLEAATVGSGKLTTEQVRECVQVVYFDGYSDGCVNRGQHLEETDWQAIADELNAAMGWACEFEISTDMTAVKCSKCGYRLPKGTDLAATRFCGGCGKAVKR